MTKSKYSIKTRKRMSESQKKRFATSSHPSKGRIVSKETRQKQSKAKKGKNHPFYGKKRTEETKRKMSESHKGLPSPNKGKILSKEVKERMSRAKKGLTKETSSRALRQSISLQGKMVGDKNPFYGRRHTEETKNKIRAKLAFHAITEETRKKLSEAGKGRSVWNKGIPMTASTKRKVSKSLRGELNPAWDGGKSFEPYNIDFNKELKEKVRKLKNHTCQVCLVNESIKAHDVHHIDYNKLNNNIDNMTLLCDSCHGKTNHNRHFWHRLLKDQL